jgi:hypothetical protein
VLGGAGVEGYEGAGGVANAEGGEGGTGMGKRRFGVDVGRADGLK